MQQQRKNRATGAASPTFVAQIEHEHQQYQREDVLHNRDLHQRIIMAWEQESPNFHARLRRAGILDKTAFVMQERMWRASKALRGAGLSAADAREQAERDHLMMEPENVEATPPTV